MYNASTAQHKLNLDMKNLFSFPQLILEEFRLIIGLNYLFRISFPDSPFPVPSQHTLSSLNSKPCEDSYVHAIPSVAPSPPE